MEMGIFRHISDHPGHPPVQAPVGVYGLAHGILFTEILERRGLTDHHRLRLVQSRTGVAGQERQLKHFEKIGIRGKPTLFAEHLFPVTDHGIAQPPEPGRRLHFREIGVEDRGHGGTCLHTVHGVPLHDSVVPHPIYPLRVRQMAIKTQLMLHPHEHQDAAGDADTQPEDFDQ